MGIIAVRNGAASMLIEGGKWDATEVSTCDFGIAEFSGSCVILQPGPGTVIVPESYGTMGESSSKRRDKAVMWDIFGVAFVKDMGNPKALLGNLWTAIDDVISSIDADDTLGGTASAAHIATISRPNFDAFFEYQGTLYGYITFTINAYDRLT